MRDAQKHALQVELRDKVLARILVIQHWVRAKIMRCRFLHMRRSAIVLQVRDLVKGCESMMARVGHRGKWRWGEEEGDRHEAQDAGSDFNRQKDEEERKRLSYWVSSGCG